MSTAVASASAMPLAPPPEPDVSPKSSYPTLAPSSHTPSHVERSPSLATPHPTSTNMPVVTSESTAQQKVTLDGKRSPNS